MGKLKITKSESNKDIMSKSLFIHVGPPKTATSFLQKEVIDRVKSLKCIIRPKINLYGRSVFFGDLFRWTPRLWGSKVGNTVLQTLLGEAKRTERSVLISSERIYGGLAPPRPWMSSLKEESLPAVRLNIHSDSRPSPCSLSQHLKHLSVKAGEWGFSNVKVLYTMRRQDTMIASLYAQLSNRVRGASQSNFENWVQYIVKDPLGYTSGGGRKLDYSLCLREIAKKLGKTNVLFLPLELLKEQPSMFLDKWMDFIEAENKEEILQVVSGKKGSSRSTSDSSWRLQKPIRSGPHLRPTRLFQAMSLPLQIPLRWPDFSREKEIHLTSEMSKMVLGTYGSSNRAIDGSVNGLRLRKYGYY